MCRGAALVMVCVKVEVGWRGGGGGGEEERMSRTEEFEVDAA